MYLGLP
jgi:hypothetical protein